MRRGNVIFSARFATSLLLMAAVLPTTSCEAPKALFVAQKSVALARVTRGEYTREEFVRSLQYIRQPGRGWQERAAEVQKEALARRAAANAAFVKDRDDLSDEVKAAILADRLVVGMRKPECVFVLRGLIRHEHKRPNPLFRDIKHDQWMEVVLRPRIASVVSLLMPEYMDWDMCLLFYNEVLVAIFVANEVRGLVQGVSH